MLYLSKVDWSPRFGSDFYTIELNTRTTLSASPSTEQDDYHAREGHTFPAVYFTITIQYDKKEYNIQRRYSQFRKIYEEIKIFAAKSGDTSTSTQKDTISFPPKTCFFQTIDEEFLDVRQEELYAFLDNILKRPDYANLPCVKEFLEVGRLLQ